MPDGGKRAAELSVVEWEAPEFEYREKSVSWYWLSIIAAAAILAASVWQKNFLFAVFVVIAEILVLVWAGRKPRMINFRLDDKELTVGGGKFYSYSEIEAYGTEESGNGEWSEMAFRLRHGLHPWLKIRIRTARLPEAEKALGPSVKKTELETSLLDSLGKLIGF